MNAITLKQAKRRLEQLVEQVVADAEPTIVISESGAQVVFLPLDEYHSWKETLYLLSSPANARHLRRSLAEAREGKAQERELLEARGWSSRRRRGKTISGSRLRTASSSSASTC